MHRIEQLESKVEIKKAVDYNPLPFSILDEIEVRFDDIEPSQTFTDAEHLMILSLRKEILKAVKLTYYGMNGVPAIEMNTNRFDVLIRNFLIQMKR